MTGAAVVAIRTIRIRGVVTISKSSRGVTIGAIAVGTRGVLAVGAIAVGTRGVLAIAIGIRRIVIFKEVFP